MPLSRRQFIKNSLFAGLLSAVGVGSYSAIIEPNWFRTTKYNLKTSKWPKSRKSLKIAIASDFHVGCPSVKIDTVHWLVQHLNAMNADCILLLGDYLIKGVLGGKPIKPVPIGEALSGLKAPYGVYAVLGNHDWWGDGPGMWAALEKAGIMVLENDSIHVEHPQGRFWISGLADDMTRTPDISKTLHAVTNDDPVIMMSHDPAPFLEMQDRPVVTLSGHTHGGQVAPPFWGALVIPGRAPIRYAYGHIHEDGKDLIVSSGLGTSRLPVRFNRRPELVELTISSAVS